MSKGSTLRPSQVPEEAIAESFDRIGITCKRCGKTGLHHDGVHTCSPQYCNHEFVLDEEAVMHMCCQKCGQVEMVK